MRCLDCGNKAKKDCFYFRCRSCCRGRGFECQTHVKSTWVPISTRQVVRNAAAAMVASSSAGVPDHHVHHQQEEQPPSSFGFGEQFPTDVSGEATFTRIQVSTSVEEHAVVEQYAYESSINIRGHVFKGILYDQGPSRPLVNSSDMNVHHTDQHISTIDVRSTFQPLVDPSRPSVSSIPPGYSPSTL